MHCLWETVQSCESCSVVSDSWRPHELYSPWNSLGQNTGVCRLRFSRGSSQPRDRTQVSCIAIGFTNWAIGEAPSGPKCLINSWNEHRWPQTEITEEGTTAQRISAGKGCCRAEPLWGKKDQVWKADMGGGGEGNDYVKKYLKNGWIIWLLLSPSSFPSSPVKESRDCGSALFLQVGEHGFECNFKPALHRKGERDEACALSEWQRMIIYQSTPSISGWAFNLQGSWRCRLTIQVICRSRLR